MTNYNDGNWHGWNGGKCPVHPETLVDAVWVCADADVKKWTNIKAGDLQFETNEYGSVVAFCVVEKNKKQREFWLRINDDYGSISSHPSIDDAKLFNQMAGTHDTEIIHVREVIE